VHTGGGGGVRGRRSNDAPLLCVPTAGFQPLSPTRSHEKMFSVDDH
jgi:hypothetical protein